MVRLSHELLMRAHRFLLEIHAERDVDALRRLIPQGLSRIIACDRAAFNELDLGRKPGITCSPQPPYWQTHGPVMVEYLHEHTLANRTSHPPTHVAATFGDRRNDPAWRDSTLYHEYYRAVGVRHQLGVNVIQRGNVRFLLSCNRSGRDFSATDRTMIELLSPHVAQAWRHATALSLLRRQQHALGGPGGPMQHLLVVDPHARVIAPLASGSLELLQKYFGEEAGEGRELPELLSRWLQAQHHRLASAAALTGLLEDLTVFQSERSLVVRLLQSGHFASLLVLEEHESLLPAHFRPLLKGFTRRESEILGWIREGKRNSEIARILGLSTRTVGKHLEHIFTKLGVETRTAAVRATDFSPNYVI